MDIKKARDEDLIDVLYLLKQEITTTCKTSECPPNPDYSHLREEIRKGTIHILEHHKISIGTFSVHQPHSGEEKNGDVKSGLNKNGEEKNGEHLRVDHLTIASYWINNDTLQEMMRFLEETAKNRHVPVLRLMVNRHNKKMNTFLKNLGFDFVREESGQKDAMAFNVFEKKLMAAS
mgnify:CR=1 FL=1